MLEQINGKKVLITGGLGFIGSNLAKKCLDLGAEVTILDNLMADTGANMFNIEEIKDKVKVVIGDMRDRQVIEEHIKEKDVIFNLAAQVSHVLSMENPWLDIDINCRGHIMLLEACRKNNPNVKIVYCGTRTQTGPSETGIVDEKTQDNPSDVYGAGKLAAELYHLIYYKVYGIKTTSLRMTNIYGSKAQVINPKYGVINWFIGKAVLNEVITIFGEGEQLRDILFVDDAVDSLILAAVNERSNGEIFVIGSGKGFPLIEIGQKIVNAAGNGEVKKVPWPEERKHIEVGDSVLDIRKAKDVLGWEPKTTIEEGLKKTTNFYKGYVDKYLDKKMKVLVTGGLGHIGSRLIREYAKREDIETIRILDNFLVQRYCSLFDLPENKKYEFIEGDINNHEDLDKAMKDIDLVVHLAAVTDAPATINDKEGTTRVNFEGTKNVLDSAIKHKVKKFLFPSTTSVYGEAEGLVDENWPEENYKPSSPYAESKKACEKLVLQAYTEHGLNTNVLRLGTIFGKSIGMRFHTAVNKFCYLAALNKPLTVWDTAINNKRPYLGLGDAIKAFEFAEKKTQPGELYNVLTKNYTVQEMVDQIRKVVPDLQIEITKSPILNQKSYHVSDKKIRDIGFTPEDDIGESIKETIELFRAINNKDM